MATSTFDRKIEHNTRESIEKLINIMNAEPPVKPLSTHPYSIEDRNRSKKLLKQYLSR